MWPYFVLITPIALAATMARGRQISPFFWTLAFVAIWMFVGLRHHVGMDWNNYLLMIENANAGSFVDAFVVSEPGYAILLWIPGQLGLGIYGTYFLGTAIFLAGLFRYARSTPTPWVALMVALPILVIVVAMSAARQTVAIGILLWLTAEWNQASAMRRAAFILLASTFHASAIAFLIFVLLDLRMQRWLKVVGTAIMSAAMVNLLQSTGQADYYDALYVSGATEITRSEGAIMHVMLNGGPALAALLAGRRWRSKLIPDHFHMQLTMVAISLIPLSFVTSAAAGRMSLYLFPVSMYFFSSLSQIMANTGSRSVVRGMIALFFLLITVIWLNFGNSASAHKNYQNALTIPTAELRLCC